MFSKALKVKEPLIRKATPSFRAGFSVISDTVLSWDFNIFRMRLNPIHTVGGGGGGGGWISPPSHFFLYNFWSIHSYTFKFCDFSKLLFESIMGKKFFGKYALATTFWQWVNIFFLNDFLWQTLLSMYCKKKKKKRSFWGKTWNLGEKWRHRKNADVIKNIFARTCSLSVGAHLWQVSRQKHNKWRSYVGGGRISPPPPPPVLRSPQKARY